MPNCEIFHNYIITKSKQDGSSNGRAHRGHAHPAGRQAKIPMLGTSVARDCRGQGVGRVLMPVSIDEAEPNPLLRLIELYVVTRNQPTVKLYEALDPKVDRRRKTQYRDGQFHDGLRMALLLDD
jgi:ribosomal protein S18 acetylase RimI-like enzyme